MLSDSDSKDSDEGIRFKTHNTREKYEGSNSDKSYKELFNERRHTERRYKDKYQQERYKYSSYRSTHRRNERSSSSEEEKRSRQRHESKYRSEARNSASVTKRDESVRKRATTSPELPQHVRQLNKITEYSERTPDQMATNDIISIGPALPLHLTRENEKFETKERSDFVSAFTSKPSLSPKIFNKRKEDDIVSHSLGPSLPPHLRNSLKSSDLECGSKNSGKFIDSSKSEISQDCNEENNEKNVIGPELPPHLKVKIETSTEEKKDNLSEPCTSIIGPSLPTHVQQKTSECEEKKPVIGPELPPMLRAQICLPNDNELTENKKEPEDDSSEDEEMYGPLPPGMIGRTDSQIALEERAIQLKMEQLEPNKRDVKSREEWMLALPENRASNLGLGPRQFRAKAGPDLSDRSCWTDTPEDKKKKKDKGELKDARQLSKQKEIDAKDAIQEEIVKKHKKKRKESLLELHQKKMKKQKQVEGPSERRPFSRELDLQVNRFDEAQKKSVMKKAQLLDDRFTRGQSKFI